MDTERGDSRGASGGRAHWRTLGLGAAAIAVFATAGVAVIWAMGDGSPGEARPAPAGPVQPVAVGPPPPAPVLPRVLPAPPATSAAPPAPEDLDPSWRQVPVVVRDGLGPVGGYVFSGLRRAQEEMKHCRAGAAASTSAAPAVVADDAPAVILLYLVAREGAIDVVEARTEEVGSEGAQVVECCRAVLQGQEFKAPNAQPGRRYRLRYAL